jgi:hypothetical protein
MKRNLSTLQIFVVSSLFAILANSAHAGEVTLEDQSLLVQFDSDFGALTRLENKTTHWVIERRPELGISFRLFAPLPNRRYNPILGQKQHAVSAEKLSNHEVRIKWINLLSENGGVLPMTFTATVTLTNGTLTFGGELINDSPLTVETIDYPYFGDFNPPTRSTPMEARTLQKGKDGLQADEIYPHFKNAKGYWGVFYPTKMFEAQPSRFCLIQTSDEGLYVEIANPLPYRLQYTFEQHPGVISSITDLVPQADEISGAPVHLEFRTCHFVFAHPHSNLTLAPVVLSGYSGDWHVGANLYKKSHSVPDANPANP